MGKDGEQSKETAKDINVLESFVCGGVGGFLTQIVGHPFDTIKVRLQTDTRYKNTWECVSDTFSRDGVRGFYRGISAPLTVVVPVFAIAFMGYKMGKNMLTAATGTRVEDFNWMHFAWAGAFAGTLTSMFLAPAERLKCLMQVAEQNMTAEQRKEKKIGLLNMFNHVYRDGGIVSVYRGTCATLLRDVPGTAIYFVTYEILMRFMFAKSEIDPCSQKANLLTIFAGGTAGMSYWITGLPADVLKSRVQTAPNGVYPYGMRSAFPVLIKKEGPQALFSGIVPVMLRSFPANAFTFLGFELARSTFHRIKGISPCA